MVFKRHRMLATITALSLLLMPNNQALAEEVPTTLYESTTDQVLAKGLTYEHKEKLTSEGWVSIHVLKMDLEEPTLSLDVIRNTEMFAGREGLSDMLDQNADAVGGINGSFFSMGSAVSDVEGLEVSDGNVSSATDAYNSSTLRAASVIQNIDGSVLFDFVHTELKFLTTKGVDVYLVGVNTVGSFNNPTIFNKEAFDDTSTIDSMASLYKIVVSEGSVIAKVGPNETTTIPENGYVLVMNDKIGPSVFSKINIGDGANLSVETNVNLNQVKTAISGGGMILEDGKMVEEGLIVSKNGRNPRTALGITSDGKTLIAMVVDGRGESIGATHKELASYLIEYDVITAMHFDGGGSSTLSAKTLGNFSAEAMNTPSDGYERPVVNGLGFVSNAPKTADYKLYLTSSQNRSFINNQVKLELKAYDMNYNPVEVDQTQVAWGLSGGYGKVDNMIFTPLSAGDVKLTAYYQGKNTSLMLDVSETLIDIEIEPKVMNLSDGEKTFKVIGTDANGYKSVIDNRLLTWSISEPIGSINDGHFVPNGTIKDARVDVSYNGIKEVAYVVTGDKVTGLTDMNSLTVTSLVYPETVSGSAQMTAYNGQGAIELDYRFAGTDFAQAVYAVMPDLKIYNPIDQLRLSIDEWPEDLALKAHITDVSGEQYSIDFNKDLQDGVVSADMIEGIAYPITLKRLYVVGVGLVEAKEGRVRITNIETVTQKNMSDLDEVVDIAPEDPLINPFPGEGFDITLFGATSGRNRLLDEVVLKKVYSVLNKADYAIYAGATSVDESAITNNHLIYKDAFTITDLADVRIMTLAMSEGGLVSTDASQWQKFDQSLSQAVQDTILIVGTERLVDNEDSGFTREGALLHSILRDFSLKSGKKVFYVNASGYQSKLEYFEGIRYIDLNGLWYKVGTDHEVDLYDSFQTVTITISGGKVSYKMEDLYPKTTIQ